jgi:ABC-type multidrug transport system permease subunit
MPGSGVGGGEIRGLVLGVVVTLAYGAVFIGALLVLVGLVLRDFQPRVNLPGLWAWAVAVAVYVGVPIVLTAL